MKGLLVTLVLLSTLFSMSWSKVVKPVVLEASGTHTSTLIFLHGLGDAGSSWAPAFYSLQELVPGLKVVCPTAPSQPVTLNGGMRMPSWHDIRSLDQIDAGDFAGLDDSVASITNLIDQEIKSGIESKRIVVGGFSQGAAISLMTGYQYPNQLGGVIALSGYLPHAGEFSEILKEENGKTPALVCHGDADMVVQYKYGKSALERLQEAGVPAEFKTYSNMGHSACNQEINDVEKFVVGVLEMNQN